jgi:hypothetical protein
MTVNNTSKTCNLNSSDGSGNGVSPTRTVNVSTNLTIIFSLITIRLVPLLHISSDFFINVNTISRHFSTGSPII